MDKIDNFISDEMLAAHIDGHSLPIEDNIINKYMECDEIQELLGIVSDIKDNPELIDVAEQLQSENPDNFIDGGEDSFLKMKRDIQGIDKNIM